MAFTYDSSTALGRIRLLCTDTRASNYIFEDDEIEAFYALESSNVYRAAALALETIAADHARTLKVVQVQDVRVDGAKSADALLKRAKQLRDLADKLEDEASSELGFAFIEQARTEAQFDELISKQWLI